MKQHQRAWTLQRDVAEVRWTFDPLLRRNGYFNLHKLGAEPVEYLPEFYGAMTDGINAGDLSDRLRVRWRLTAPAAVAAAHGEARDVDLAALFDAGAGLLLDRDADGAPSTVNPRQVPNSDVLLVSLPDDIEALRQQDPVAALQWRYAVRDALVPALGAGYRITGLSRYGFYILERA